MMVLVIVLLLTLLFTPDTAVAISLPGILSPDACLPSGDDGPLAAVCYCRKQHNVTDLASLCLHVDALSDCVADYIVVNYTGRSYLSLVFDQAGFKKTTKWFCTHLRDNRELCDLRKDECDAKFISILRNTSYLNQEQACMISDYLGQCHWQALRGCPGRPRHMWTRLAQAFSHRNCTKYGTVPAHRDCGKIVKAYLPKPIDVTNYEQCIDMAATTWECMELEQVRSLHATAIWEMMEREVKTYMHFQRVVCRLTTQRKISCDESLRKCGDGYYQSYLKQTDILKRGENVTVQDVCSVYDTMASCIVLATNKCPVARRQELARFCSVMPRSCHCPLNHDGSYTEQQAVTEASSSASMRTLFHVAILRKHIIVVSVLSVFIPYVFL
ncbi:uncharacterized protein LOC128226578 isoform X2 [Mya arenaria]|uniref:uncharacterized protein LOC128226578 isoform X2 n=1 Tax=Mya arenaria TaxID=6604 RepID=UPI0022E02E59|nr:uncharacterized protein LOC128226578 isoform X2 [Mya arenaria]